MLSRITVNLNVGHGKPTIRNKRYLVESSLEYLAGGDTIEEYMANAKEAIELYIESPGNN